MRLLLIICLFASSLLIGAESRDFLIESSFKQGCIMEAGKPVSVDFSLVYPEKYTFCGTSVFAYCFALPCGFCEALCLLPSKPQDPKWASVQLEKMTWLPASERVKRTHARSFTTEGWPAGDYCVTFSFFFQIPGRKDPKLDKYVHSTVFFSLE